MASLIADGSHLHGVLAREFWRCSGLAENAKTEANKSDEVTRAFQEEYDKWQARANEILRLLGGEWPENPLLGASNERAVHRAGHSALTKPAPRADEDA